jgi:hypothetical protein
MLVSKDLMDVWNANLPIKEQNCAWQNVAILVVDIQWTHLIDIMVLYTKVNFFKGRLFLAISVSRAKWRHWISSKYDLFWTKGQFLHPTPWVVTKQTIMLGPFLIITFWAHYSLPHINNTCVYNAWGLTWVLEWPHTSSQLQSDICLSWVVLFVLISFNASFNSLNFTW